MTRINLVPPQELTDQHLIAEYRELTMVPASLRRSLRTQSWEIVKKKIPANFTLNGGHVTFFYDKFFYLRSRFIDICVEMQARGFKYTLERFEESIKGLDMYHHLNVEWRPSQSDLDIVRQRINLRISQKPGWYRKNGVTYTRDEDESGLTEGW